MALSTGLSTSNPYVTVTRTATDGEYILTRTVAGVETPVRGTLVVTGGTGFLVDREAPQGVSVTYKSGADTTVVVTNLIGSWLIHPTTQSLDRAVTVEEFPTWSYDVRQDSVTPLGSSRPIVVSDARQSRVGGIKLFVNGATEVTNLTATLSSTRVLLLSTRNVRAPHLWVAVGKEQWEPIGKAYNESLWHVDLDLTEVDRPEQVSSGVVTWLDVEVRYPGTDGFDDLGAMYGTFDAFWADAANWTS